MLKCVACGREVAETNDHAETQVTCPSCGGAMKPLAAGGADDAWLDATTQRVAPEAIAPSATPNTAPPATPAFVDVPTAIVAPPAAPSSAMNANVGNEQDQYKTAIAIEKIDTVPQGQPTPTTPTWPSAGITDPYTQPVIEESSSSTENLPPTVTPNKQTGGRRRLWLVIGAIVLLVALFAGGLALAQGNGLNSTAQHVPTVGSIATTAHTTLPPGFIAVVDPQQLYRLGVPSNWIAKPAAIPNAEALVYLSPAQDATFEIESFPTGSQQSGATLDTFILMNAFSSAKLSNQTAATNTPFAGATWVQETADATITVNGTPQVLHVVVQSTTHNGHIFIIIDDIAVDGSTAVNSQTVQNMLITFTFLG